MAGDSEVNDSGCATVAIDKYVAQLEKRIKEQETLIELLKEKVATLEESAGSTSPPSGGMKRSYSNAARTAAAAPDTATVTGSRKCAISAVQTTRYSHFFITRIEPSVSAAELTRDLLTYATELKSVVCSKISTKHSSYSSFHLTIPEEQKHLISGGEAWPEGVLVKPFMGKLLNNYVIERFDSLHPDGDSSSQATAVASRTPSNNQANKTKSSTPRESVVNNGRPPKGLPAKGTNSRAQPVQQSPLVSSPKNGVQTRNQKTK